MQVRVQVMAIMEKIDILFTYTFLKFSGVSYLFIYALLKFSGVSS